MSTLDDYSPLTYAQLNPHLVGDPLATPTRPSDLREYDRWFLTLYAGEKRAVGIEVPALGEYDGVIRRWWWFRTAAQAEAALVTLRAHGLPFHVEPLTGSVRPMLLELLPHFGPAADRPVGAIHCEYYAVPGLLEQERRAFKAPPAGLLATGLGSQRGPALPNPAGVPMPMIVVPF